MITITIPKNDYVKPSEPRQEVVQRMVDILIKEVNRGFVGEFCANNCWRRTFGIGRHKETKRDEFLTDCMMYVILLLLQNGIWSGFMIWERK